MKYTRYVDTAKDEWNSMLRTVADPRPTSMTSTTRMYTKTKIILASD